VRFPKQQDADELPHAIGAPAILQFAAQQPKVVAPWIALEWTALIQQSRLWFQHRQVVAMVEHIRIIRVTAWMRGHDLVFAHDLDSINEAAHLAWLSGQR
jgi:hypothetical protein